MDITEYLSKFFKGTKEPSLKAMEFFMEEFGHPEKNLNIIHIAGTNGKGSCAEMITNVLIHANYKVGKFMSPHLIKYNERISIQNSYITDKELQELIEIIEPKIEKFESINNTKITLFELETTMAILYFYRNNCDIVVLETGLGGTYDCTNIVNPLISIITSIGFDHMDLLGNTLLEIAENKAGIIKENSETIFLENEEKDVNNKIVQTCKEKNNVLHLITKGDISNYSYDNNYQKFDYKNYKNIQIPLKGEKQIYNASIAIECIDTLKKKDYNITKSNIKDGLKTVEHKGRFEVINKNPLIIYDGAHNIPAIHNFINTVNMYYKERKKVYIFQILKTKEYKEILKELLKDEQSIFIFTGGSLNGNYVSKEDLYNEAKEHTQNKNLYMKELKDAILLAKEEYKDFVTFIVGSFYIYGDVV